MTLVKPEINMTKRDKREKRLRSRGESVNLEIRRNEKSPDPPSQNRRLNGFAEILKSTIRYLKKFIK